MVVPEESKLKSWAAANGVEGDVAAICASDKAAAHYLAELTATAKDGKLKGFEIVKAVHLEPSQFTVEVRGALTKFQPGSLMQRSQSLHVYLPGQPYTVAWT